MSNYKQIRMYEVKQMSSPMRYEVMVPETAKVLTFDTAGVGFFVWAEVALTDVEPTRTIDYLIILTGGAPPEDETDWVYLKTVFYPSFGFVWHIYELKPEDDTEY